MFYNWKAAFFNSHFRNRFIISVIAVLFILLGLASFSAHVEIVRGNKLYDPILNFIKPRDVSGFTFFVTYIAAIIGFVYTITSPYKFLHLIQMYGVLTLLRFITLFVIPFDPPIPVAQLKEEVLMNNLYTGNEYLRSLLFSGHAATLFLFYFFTTNKILKISFLVAAISVSIGAIIQHEYYSYDVLVAPIFAFIAYRLTTKFSKHYQTDASK
jgi:hypothetical protein